MHVAFELQTKHLFSDVFIIPVRWHVKFETHVSRHCDVSGWLNPVLNALQCF